MKAAILLPLATEEALAEAKEELAAVSEQLLLLLLLLLVLLEVNNDVLIVGCEFRGIDNRGRGVADVGSTTAAAAATAAAPVVAAVVAFVVVVVVFEVTDVRVMGGVVEAVLEPCAAAGGK